jgi:F-type H+-transporting ATPase subunit epsilon
MRVTIARVDETLFDGEAHSLTVPAAGGEMTVLGHHMPIVTTLKSGNAIVRVTESDIREFPVEGGVLEVRSEGATVIL